MLKPCYFREALPWTNNWVCNQVVQDIQKLLHQNWQTPSTKKNTDTGVQEQNQNAIISATEERMCLVYFIFLYQGDITKKEEAWVEYAKDKEDAKPQTGTYVA